MVTAAPTPNSDTVLPRRIRNRGKGEQILRTVGRVSSDRVAKGGGRGGVIPEDEP